MSLVQQLTEEHSLSWSDKVNVGAKTANSR